jgi:hypothetical protein
VEVNANRQAWTLGSREPVHRPADHARSRECYLLLPEKAFMKIPKLVVAALTILATQSAIASIPDDVSGTRPGTDGGPTEVVVGVYLIDVSKVDGADQSFTADLFVVQSWHDSRLAGVFDKTERVDLDEVWNPRLQILNRRQISTTFPDQAEIAPDGTVTSRQRYFGSFSSPLDLHDFPLDAQRFVIRMVVPGYDPDEVRMVPSPEQPTGAGRSESFSVPDWDLGAIEAHPEPYHVAAVGRDIAGTTVTLDGRRHIGFWAGKALVSIMIIIAMSWVVFWVDPKYIAPRLSVAVTSMLTLIAYRFLLDGILPRLAYLTRMDYFLVGSTLLVFVTVLQVAVTTRAEDRGHHRRAQRINLHSRWLIPTMYLTLLGVCFLA